MQRLPVALNNNIPLLILLTHEMEVILDTFLYPISIRYFHA